jgi:hypothetical protein
MMTQYVIKIIVLILYIDIVTYKSTNAEIVKSRMFSDIISVLILIFLNSI